MGKDKKTKKEKERKKEVVETRSEPQINLLGIGQRIIEAGSIAAGAMVGSIVSNHYDFSNSGKLVAIGGGAVAGYGIGRGVNVGMAALIMADKEDLDEDDEDDDEDEDSDE